MLIIAARTVGEPAYQEMIKEMDRELTKVVADFDRAVNVETLRRTKKTGEGLDSTTTSSLVKLVSPSL